MDLEEFIVLRMQILKKKLKKTFILTALNVWAGSVDFNCIYLYVGLKTGDNSCK